MSLRQQIFIPQPFQFSKLFSIMKTFVLALVKSFFVAFFVIAATNSTYANLLSDKTTEKARSAVAAAAPDDWKTYAESAAKCIRKGVNMKEATTG
jgi:uncharacterized protein (DUF2147 family)